MFHINSFLIFSLVFCLFLVSQFVAFLLFERQNRLKTLKDLFKALIPEIQPHFQALEPALFRRQFQFEQAQVMGGANPADAQETDDLVFRCNDRRFKGVSFFYRCSFLSGFQALEAALSAAWSHR